MTCKTIFSSLNIIWIVVACLNAIPAVADVPDAILLHHQTDLFVKNNKLYISRSYELKINNRRGDQYAAISIPYSKMNKVSKIEAFIKDKEGITVKRLKSGDIKERSSISDFSFYEDNFVKEFTMIHNVYPYTLCYSYQEQEDAFFYLEHWSPVIDNDVPTLNAILTLDVPLDYKIAHSSHLVDSSTVDTVGMRVKYCWKASYGDQLESEIHSPHKSIYVPGVVIVPNKFKFDQEGSFASWKTYGNWLYRLLDGLSDLPEDEKQHIRSLISNVKEDKEKIRILYHYLQDATRYIYIGIETGGMKPYPASYVAVNKYGDCKALTNYFKSVLSYIGIPSFYTNVQAGDLIKKIDEQFPSMQFNHVILCVPLQHDTVWLDCTSHGPFNYLGTFTQNRRVLLIDKENSQFKKTPALSKKDVLDSRTIQVNCEKENDIIANFHNTYKGESFEILSDLNRSVNDTRKSEIIRKYVIESGIELVDFNLIPSHRDSAFIRLNYTGKANKLFKKYGNELLISLVPFSIPAFKDPKNRKYPVQLDYPVNKLDTIRYQIPLGYQLSVLPKNQTVSSDFGNYSIRFVQNNMEIEVIKNFVLNAGEYTLAQYGDFYKFVKTVYDIENNSYIITKKQDQP
ncbi:MAG: DUF3857 domain-containing protein [Bacteroidota bacterium]|nr:DUF3857 domain-containing protein [Bacteroidota bacterium]